MLLSSFLLPNAWNADVMVRIGAAILDGEMMLEMGTTEPQDKKSLAHPSTPCIHRKIVQLASLPYHLACWCCDHRISVTWWLRMSAFKVR